MLVRAPSPSMLVLLCLGLLWVALVVVLTNSSRRIRALDCRAVLQPFHSAARLGTRLSDAANTLVAAIARDASCAIPVTVEVLLEDRVQRARTHRHTRAVLARCIAAMGTPPASCAVLIARRVERDGRALSGCVEQLTSSDGAIRTLIFLSIESETGTLAPDAIAAKLAGYYLIATGAERTVLIADPPAPFPRPATGAATRVPSPEAICRIALPIIVDGKRA